MDPVNLIQIPGVDEIPASYEDRLERLAKRGRLVHEPPTGSGVLTPLRELVSRIVASITSAQPTRARAIPPRRRHA